MIFTVYFSSSGSWCFEMCPTGRGVGTLLLDEIQKLQVGNPAETPKKKTGTSNYPWLRQVTLSPCAYIYIYTYIHTLWASPILRTTQVECRLKRRKCGMERVVFDGFRQFWNLQSCSIFHRWFPWGNQHGNVICCKKAVEHSCTPCWVSEIPSSEDHDGLPCYLDSGRV